MVVELNGKKYLLIELAIFSADSMNNTLDLTRTNNGIVQSSRIIRASFFSRGYTCLCVLIPEENALPFSNNLVAK